MVSTQASGQAIQLNSFVDIDTDFVTVGDIFSPMKHGGDHVIMSAPKPGQETILDAQTLRRIARSFKLNWLPNAVEQQVIIRRLGTEIAPSLVTDSLQKAIITAENIKPRAGQQWVVKLDNAPNRYFAPSSSLPELQVKSIQYDALSSRFQADVSLYQGGSNVRVRGEFFAVVSVPMPIHSIAANEDIRLSDLHFIDMRKDKISPNVQTDVNRIVGKSSKRLLRADSPIAIQYLQEPLLVKRNALVSVIYSVKNLTLVTKGKALSDGSIGQVVQIQNLKSNRIIDSVVTGSDEVSVSFAGDA